MNEGAAEGANRKFATVAANPVGPGNKKTHLKGESFLFNKSNGGRKKPTGFEARERP